MSDYKRGFNTNDTENTLTQALNNRGKVRRMRTVARRTPADFFARMQMHSPYWYVDVGCAALTIGMIVEAVSHWQELCEAVVRFGGSIMFLFLAIMVGSFLFRGVGRRFRHIFH